MPVIIFCVNGNEDGSPHARDQIRQAARSAELTERQAAAWLAGEAIPIEGRRGWTLACYLGMPLGWGKWSDGTLKNHLPKGLRHTIFTT